MAEPVTATPYLDQKQQQQLEGTAVSPALLYADGTGQPVLVSVAETADVITFTFNSTVCE